MECQKRGNLFYCKYLVTQEFFFDSIFMGTYVSQLTVNSFPKSLLPTVVGIWEVTVCGEGNWWRSPHVINPLKHKHRRKLLIVQKEWLGNHGEKGQRDLEKGWITLISFLVGRSESEWEIDHTLLDPVVEILPLISRGMRYTHIICLWFWAFLLVEINLLTLKIPQTKLKNELKKSTWLHGG